MSRRPIWEELFGRFDPAQPAEVPAWRAERPLSPFEEIIRSLDRPAGRVFASDGKQAIPRILLTGTVGTGKSTELLRIAEARASKEFVVFLNLERHFEQVVGDSAALQQVSPWEVCFLAGIALLRSAQEKLGFDFPEVHLRALEQAWRKVAQSSEAIQQDLPAIDIPKLAKAMVLLASNAAPVVGGIAGAAVGSGLGVLAAATDAGKWSLPVGLKKKSLPDQDAQVQTLLSCVNTLIGLVQRRASRVLLIIDGLDRIESFERAKELFLDSKMIGHLACRIVLCGPYSLRETGNLANVYAFSDVPPLVNVPVLSYDNPALPGPGVSFFGDLFARRIADLGAPDLIPADLLTRLAYYSGGRAREFVHFIRRLAQFSWDEDVLAATRALVDKVLDERRRVREMGLNKGHIRVLTAVLTDPDHQLPEDELANKLLATGALLPYPDGSEWYYPHPLLTMNLVRVKRPGSTR